MRLLVIALVIGCAGRPATTAIPADRAQPFAPLRITMLDGATWSTTDAAGSVIVLDVWATWCKPCKKAFPKLARLAQTYPDVRVVGLSVDTEDRDVHRFLREVPAGIPIARVGEAGANELAVSQLPAVIVVDKRGRVRMRAEKLVESDYDELFALVDALRAEN